MEGSLGMSFVLEVFSTAGYTREAAARVVLDLPGEGGVVLTGGTTAERLYPEVAAAHAGWGSLDVFFSDERCVPPTDDRSNFGMVNRLLLEDVKPASVHRMKGEEEPITGARLYAEEVTSSGRPPFDFVLLGMGGDCHIAGMFPGATSLHVASELCVAVERPDGLTGLTLAPPALVSAMKILLVVEGEAKAEAVRRVVAGDEPPDECPARLLADHDDVTFLLDEAAASLL